MAIEIVIPMLGVTVENGTVQQWLKKEGDQVNKGDVVFIVESEKVTTEVESPGAGTLGKILVPEGVEVPLMTVAAHLLAPGEADPGASGPAPAAAPAPAAEAAAPAPAAAPAASGVNPADIPGVTEVVLPMLGVTVENGMVTEWKVKEGDTVKKGDVLYIVESEKVTTEVEAPADGTLAKILVGEGVEAPLLTPVAYITAPGVTLPEIGAAPAPVAAAAPAAAAAAPAAPAAAAPALGPATGSAGSGKAMPAARKLAKDKGIDLASVTPTGPDGIILYKDVEAAVASAPSASHLAKAVAAQQGVDLAGVQGSGVRGRIMVADVQGAGLKHVAPVSYEPRVVPMTSMRKTIARRMAESAFSAPPIYFFVDVCLDPLLAYRKQVLPLFEQTAGVKISVNDFLIKAVGLTLREFPEVNASCVGDAVHYHDYAHVGLAVALPNGLIVPAITDADSAGLVHITKQRMDLVDRARQGKLTADELSRGTFTISSLAQGAVRQFTAIINPPQAGILSVPAAREDLFLKDDGSVGKRTMTTLGLTADHRIVDGAMAGDFVKALKDKLEAPAFTFMNL